MSGIDQIWKEKQAEEALKKELQETELQEKLSTWSKLIKWLKDLF